MRNITRNLALLITASCILIGAADAQSANYLATLKGETSFPSWPPGGAVQGFNFQPSQYLPLSGFSVISDVLTIDYLTYGLIRTFTLGNGSGSMTVKIGVGVGSTANGHELFLRADATDRDQDIFDILVRGDLLTPNAFILGDLNFIRGDSTPPALNGYVGFMRNNVFCILEDSPQTPTGVNLGSLAAQLDTAIMAQTSPVLPYAPPTASYSPGTTMLSASAGGTTTATVTMTDPTGNSGPLQRQFLDGGNLDVTDPGGSMVTIAATSTTGSLPLELVVVNAYLQFAISTVTFVITP
jgi:hypothetical protein